MTFQHTLERKEKYSDGTTMEVELPLLIELEIDRGYTGTLEYPSVGPSWEISNITVENVKELGWEEYDEFFTKEEWAEIEKAADDAMESV